ncbi:MAG: calcium-binding EGF-like domain-containing protein, partial [Flavobacteriaceae bacterium]|nr:calcium-binding EGF-like domain-containing protein [Flavobacteriaceae bacterium]
MQDCPGGGEVYAASGTQRCMPCPENGVCDGTPNVAVADGFWRSALTSYTFYDCRPPYAADSCTRGGACKAGYTGPRCSVCEPGFGRTALQCTPCLSRTVNWILIALVIVAMVGVVTFFSFNSISTGMQTLLSEGVRYNEFGKPIRADARQRNMIPIVVKLIVNHLQITAMAPRTSAALPGFVNDFLAGQGTVSTFSPTLNFVTCEVTPTYYEIFTVTMLAVPVAFAIFLVISAAKSVNWGLVFKRDDVVQAYDAIYAEETRRAREELLGIDDGEFMDTARAPRMTSALAMRELFGADAPGAADPSSAAEQQFAAVADANKRRELEYASYTAEHKNFAQRWLDNAMVSFVVVAFFLYPSLLQVATDLLQCEVLDYG